LQAAPIFKWPDRLGQSTDAATWSVRGPAVHHYAAALGAGGALTTSKSPTSPATNWPTACGSPKRMADQEQLAYVAKGCSTTSSVNAG